MAGPENAKRMIKKTFNISGMHCVACALNIDGELEDTPGITASNTNYAKQTTSVEFDEKIVSEEIIRTIINKLGYTTTL